MQNDDNIYPPFKMPELFITTTELDHGTFSDEQLGLIKQKCAMSGGLTHEWKNRLKEICGKLNQRALQQIVNEKIVYASEFALAELNRRRTNGKT